MQILKVVPYSAIQLCSYEAAKRHLRNKETGELSVPARLAAGAFAGMTATLVQPDTKFYSLVIMLMHQDKCTSCPSMSRPDVFVKQAALLAAAVVFDCGQPRSLRARIRNTVVNTIFPA